MSINVMVFGANKESDEYKATIKLKEIIISSIPPTAIGEIVLFANATLFGQAVKDVDLLMIGEIKSGYTVTADFIASDGMVHDKVEVRSFCTTIEVKRHDISGIFMNGTDIYVKYGQENHCVTTQSNKQKIAAMEFFKKTQLYSPYVTNLIWFTQATPAEIRGLLTNNGKLMPSNVLGSSFDFKELMQLLFFQKPPFKQGWGYLFDSGYNANSLDSLHTALSLFSKTKEQMGELTRRKIEQLTNRNLEGNALIDTNGKVSIYRGRAGTGKTVGLIQTAIRLVDENHVRVLMLTYNKALVSDIRRLFALAELPDMFEEKCIHISTLHAYFYRLVNVVLYDGKLTSGKFLEKYDVALKELIEFLQDEDSISLVKELCLSDTALDWDYVLIDEAQDWNSQERDIILNLFEKGRIIVADGGQQFVRHIDPCDWSVVRERNNIRLKYCLRQKENLVSFINAYAQKQDIFVGKVLSKNNMPGGKIIVTKDTELFRIHAVEMEKLKAAGNIAYDMLYLVPHALVKKQAGEYQFCMKNQFERHDIFIWDGTDSQRREGYSIDANEIRLLQYDSSRGLEGWTVVCMDFDVFLDEKEKEYIDGDVNSLMLESPEERKKKYLYNWAMIPLTRAIDTLIITLKDPNAKVGRILQQITRECPDYVSWI